MGRAGCVHRRVWRAGSVLGRIPISPGPTLHSAVGTTRQGRRGRRTRHARRRCERAHPHARDEVWRRRPTTMRSASTESPVVRLGTMSSALRISGYASRLTQLRPWTAHRRPGGRGATCSQAHWPPASRTAPGVTTTTGRSAVYSSRFDTLPTAPRTPCRPLDPTTISGVVVPGELGERLRGRAVGELGLDRHVVQLDV
jgi:hypothetical protein